MSETHRADPMMAAIEQLRGLLEGVSCDYLINESEAAGIQQWLEQHAEMLLDRSPFDGLAHLLGRVLADGRIDEVEHEELLDWCGQFGDEKAPGTATLNEALQRLTGAVRGLLIDNRVTPAEAGSFRDWLRDYERFKDLWPFERLWRKLPPGVPADQLLASGALVGDLR